MQIEEHREYWEVCETGFLLVPVEKSGSYINGGQSHRRRSPASPSAKNSGKEERKSVDRESNGDEGEVHGSPCSDLTDRSSPEEPHHPKRKAYQF